MIHEKKPEEKISWQCPFNLEIILYFNNCSQPIYYHGNCIGCYLYDIFYRNYSVLCFVFFNLNMTYLVSFFWFFPGLAFLLYVSVCSLDLSGLTRFLCLFIFFLFPGISSPSSIEWFIEDQIFTGSDDLAHPPPSSLFFILPVCRLSSLCRERGGGKEWRRSQKHDPL